MWTFFNPLINRFLKHYPMLANSRFIPLSILSLTALTLSAGSSFPVQKDSVISLKEISVTAIKEQNSISRPPMSVTNIGAKTVERDEIMSIKDAARLVPNLYIPDYGSRMTSSVYVRGIGARMDQPVIGLNIDNVPYLNKDNYDFDIPDIERIEVFRGPQTTLYGRNTMGGLISVYTLSPYRFQGIRGSLQYGSGNTWKLTDSYYHKFSKKLAASLSLNALRSDGFFRNEHTGEKVDHQKNFGGRLRVDHHPKDNLTISNVFSLNYVNQGGYPYKNIETDRIEYNDECSYKRLGITDGLTFTWNFRNLTISSISSYQYLNDDMKLDQDFRPVDYFTLNQKRHESTVTQDIIFRGTKKDRYTWLAGAFGFYKYGNMDAPVTFKDQGIADLIEANANRPGSPMQIKWDERQMTLNSKFRTPTAGAALYHRSSLRFGKWNISADLRLDYEHTSLKYRSFVNTSLTLYNMATPAPQPIPVKNIKVDIDESDRLNHTYLELMPKLSLEYNLNDASFYASVAKGYKSGGYNTQMFSDILQQKLMSMMGGSQAYDIDEIISFKPEKSWNFEAGSYFSFPGANLKGSLALFYIHCIDQQLTTFPEGSTTGRITSNAGRTRSFGAEFSMNYTPLKNLSFDLAYGYTNAKFRRYISGMDNFRGKYVPYAPQNTLYLSGNYTFDLSSEMKLDLGVGMNATGKIYWNEENTESQDLYALLDASATLRYDDISLSVKGQNILDKKYDLFYFESVNHKFLQEGLPARVSVTLNYLF